MVSNASDACDKLRYLATTKEKLIQDDPDLKVQIQVNKKGNSISLSARNGDSYILDLVNINSPTEESIEVLLDQYENFSEERLSSKMSEIILSLIHI